MFDAIEFRKDWMSRQTEALVEKLRKRLRLALVLNVLSLALLLATRLGLV